MYTDWISTAAFYAALQYLDSYLIQKRPPEKHTSHGAREEAIQLDKRISGIYSDYRSLKDLSQRARYDGKKPSPNEIKNDILPSLGAIKKHLRQFVPQITT